MVSENEAFLKHISYIDLKSKLKNLGALSAAEVAAQIESVMHGYCTNSIRAEMTGLYRARKNDHFNPWLSIGELWYPKASKIVKRGRFNGIGEPLFYACDTFGGAVTEVRPKPGDLITILVVRARNGLVALDNVQIGLERLKSTRFGKKGTHVLRRYAAFQTILKEQGIMKKWLLLDNFLSEMAVSLFPPEVEQEEYKITNAISVQLFKLPDIHGLVYPSVSTKLRCVNFCLMPHVADQYFVPREAWMIRIEEKISRPAPGDDEYRIRLIRRSENISADGQISWSGELQNVQLEDIAQSTIVSP